MKIFKPIFLLFFIFPLLVGSLNAQSFEFYKLSPHTINVPYIQDSNQFIQIKAVVKNNTSNSINFRFARIENNLPSGWTTQMCYDLCYAPDTDSIPLWEDPDYILAPNQIDTFFYIDFLGEPKGFGFAIVKMFNTANPNEFVQDTFRVQIGSSSVEQLSNIVPNLYELSQNYPNPFNPSTQINFSIPKNEKVNLKVYDMLGNEVASLLNNESLSAGSYNYDFNAGSFNLTSGVYFYKLSTSEFTDIKKMMLIK